MEQITQQCDIHNEKNQESIFQVNDLKNKEEEKNTQISKKKNTLKIVKIDPLKEKLQLLKEQAQDVENLELKNQLNTQIDTLQALLIKNTTYNIQMTQQSKKEIKNTKQNTLTLQQNEVHENQQENNQNIINLRKRSSKQTIIESNSEESQSEYESMPIYKPKKKVKETKRVEMLDKANCLINEMFNF